MLGRQAGGPGNVKATEYLAGEARRMGLRPAGENGGWFQTIPLVLRTLDTTSALRAGDAAFVLRKDFLVIPGAPNFPFGWGFHGESVPTVYGGRVGDQPGLDPARFAGKVVVFAPRLMEGKPHFNFWWRAGWERYRGAAGVAIATLDISPPMIVQQATASFPTLAGFPEGNAPPGVVITGEVLQRIFGKPIEQLQPGDEGTPLSGRAGFVDRPPPFPARNVVAVLPGRDPVLAREYVAVGAHSDHVGTGAGVLHDSLEAYNRVVRPGGEQRETPPTPEKWARILELRDSLRALWPERRDSVFNGAEDNASGIAAVLEVAERLAAGPRPLRSVLFVWHTAEEIRYMGAQWFTEHPTVPREAIVAQINLDGYGRRTPATGDIDGGVRGDLAVIGAGRLSSELGAVVDRVAQRDGILLDRRYDAPGEPSQYYCRSDHYQYARWGIPSVFFTTGMYPAYHQLTDDAQYIDYAGMERLTRYAADLTLAVGDLPHRPALDPGRKADPYGVCAQ
jgi:hypothetical protein